MAGIRVTHTLGGLQADFEKIPMLVNRDMKKTVREAGKVGNVVARDNARRSSGKHGKLYPRSFSSEFSFFRGFGGASYQAEYGPDASKPQGGMSFEHGSRNQPPHNDLAKSADLMGPALAGEVRRLPDNWFWP